MMNFEKVNTTQNKYVLQKDQISHSKKIDYESFWKNIFIGSSIISVILVSKVYEYHTNPLFEKVKRANLLQLFGYGIGFGIFYVSLQNLLHYLFDDYCQKYLLNYDRFKTKQARIKRSYTLVKWIYEMLFYLISSPSSLFILKQASIMPTWLGGSGYCPNGTLYLNIFYQGTHFMKIFYFIQFGKHLGRFFYHTFIRPEGNFYEYVLHHFLSSSLIFYSYTMNFLLPGIFVLSIHDLSQLFMKLVRGIRDTNYKNTIYRTIFDIVSAFLWFFCRIFLLSYCSIYSSFQAFYEVLSNPNKYPTQNMSAVLFPGSFIALMLLALEIMQIFWTYFIFKQFIRSYITQKIQKQSYD